MQVTAIGLDIAKNVFQVHGVDRHGNVVLRKRLTRAKVSEFFANLPPRLVGLEAGGGAHHWARELSARGHEARPMPPQYVRPDVKTNKHDAADAEACCEAVQRPGMTAKGVNHRLTSRPTRWLWDVAPTLAFGRSRRRATGHHST